MGFIPLCGYTQCTLINNYYNNYIIEYIIIILEYKWRQDLERSLFMGWKGMRAKALGSLLMIEAREMLQMVHE